MGRGRPVDTSVAREHLCGCGKDYLSYAALMNHIKIKHDRIIPLNSFSPDGKFQRDFVEQTEEEDQYKKMIYNIHRVEEEIGENGNVFIE